MTRLFNQYETRKVTDLSGMWDFSLSGNGDVVYSMPVPGCWEQHPDFRTFRGVGIYRKDVYIEKDTHLRLEFQGVSHTAEVYFDDVKLGGHYNAYTPFSFLIPNVTAGMHRIQVCVDNRFTEDSALHVPNDYYTYGGITRSVSLQYIEPVLIEHLLFQPILTQSGWVGKVTLFVRNISAQNVACTISSEIEHCGYTALQQTIPANSLHKVTYQISFSHIVPWDVLKPSLYYLKTFLKTENRILDAYTDRVGFREVKVEGKNILLNGNPIFFKGFNRHEDHPIFGCALPLQVMAEDVELILHTGANAVRTSHYPNDALFLDLCDERGILVWEENHARGLSIDRMKNKHFDSQCAVCIEEMVLNHYNHPSIVIWGILNECASHTPEGREKYQKQFEQLRQLDSSRPLSFASCKHFTDICLDLPDIVSINLYPLWYNDVTPKELLEKELKWVAETGAGDKPFLITETGAGAIYGNRSDTCVRWTEERQALILDQILQEYVENPLTSGVFIWQFCDCRVTEEEWFMVRPNTRNNKGILDGYRRKKLAYESVRKHFKK